MNLHEQKQIKLVESFYKNGEGLRSTPLKNYTSGDGDHDGFEGLVDQLIESVFISLGFEKERYAINGDYFNPPDEQKEVWDPQRMDHHVWIDGKCVLVVESRAWIDKPFMTLKRAVVRNFMELPYVRDKLHDNVKFAFVGLAIDTKERLWSTLNVTQGHGDRIEKFKMSPHRRGYGGGNYFDHGINQEEICRLSRFLVEHLGSFKGGDIK
jgi:hypothetical protein